MGISDNVLNSILYAAWNGGLLSFSVPAGVFDGVDLDGMGLSNLNMVVSGISSEVSSSDDAGIPFETTIKSLVEVQLVDEILAVLGASALTTIPLAGVNLENLGNDFAIGDRLIISSSAIERGDGFSIISGVVNGN